MTDKCPICLEEMFGDLGVAVPCGHCYHRECFARLKADCDAKKRASQSRIVPKCSVCTRKVKKFHKLFLSVTQCCPVEEKEKVEQTIADVKKENSKLQKRLRDLQTLSNDQSDILFRILPRYDKLESRCSDMKRDNRHLRKQVDALKDENWELLFENYETKSKLSRAELRLDEADGENMDLHDIWDTLEDQLEKSSLGERRAKRKVKKRSRELEEAKREMNTLKAGKKRLRAAITQSRDEVNRLRKMLKQPPRKKRRSS